MKPNRLDCNNAGSLCANDNCLVCPYWQRKLEPYERPGIGAIHRSKSEIQRRVVGSSGNVRIIEMEDNSYTIEITRDNLKVNTLSKLSIEDIHEIICTLNDAIQ